MSETKPQAEVCKRTPLFAEHVAMGAKMVPFAGWEMPVEYDGLRLEHQHVRSCVGAFDVSHMGEIRVRGPKSLETLQWLTSNNVALLGRGQAQYGLLTNEQGGVVDDLITYCIEPGTDYLLCVNASNTEKDWQWIQAHNRGAELVNESSAWGQIALQGPKAMGLAARIFGEEILSVKTFQFALSPFAGAVCMVARTGYTGEDGVEVFVPTSKTAELWRKIFEVGADLPVKPIGLGARDTLRTEMKYSLYGHEIDDTTNPYAAGLGWTIKPDAKDFVGKTPMLAAKAAGLKEKLVGFKMIDKGIPRQGYKVRTIDNQEIGRVTSGTLSPSLGEGVGIAYVLADHSSLDHEIAIEIRGRLVKAKVVATPFVKTRGA